MTMAIRNESDDYYWAVPRTPPSRDCASDSDPATTPGPAMKETLVGLALTLGGILAIIVMILVFLRLSGYG
jgi:hypothetical protein